MTHDLLRDLLRIVMDERKEAETNHENEPPLGCLQNRDRAHTVRQLHKQ